MKGGLLFLIIIILPFKTEVLEGDMIISLKYNQLIKNLLLLSPQLLILILFCHCPSSSHSGTR